MRFLKHPATIIATVALVMAVGGGTAAYASGLINGSQIKNHSIAAKKLTSSAIKSLRGKRGATGPAGPTGPTGPTGPQGVQGATGPAGPLLDALPSGKTERGIFYNEANVNGVGEFGSGVSLQFPAPVALTSDHVLVAGSDDPSSLCTGTYTTPTAPGGYVCVYINGSSGVTNIIGFVPVGEPTPYGFNVHGDTSSAGDVWLEGSWAYTAP